MTHVYSFLPVLASLGAAPLPVVSIEPATQQERCLPAALEAGAKVVLLSEYGGGGAPAAFNLAGGVHRTHTVAVTGTEKGRIILVVSAYEPTIWDLTAVRTRVAAVVASGYYPQGVSGLAKSTPVRFQSTLGKEFTPDDNCGPLRWAYFGLDNVKQLASTTNDLIGRHPSRYYGGYNPTGFDVDGGAVTPPRAPRVMDVRAAVPIIEDDPGGGSRFMPDYSSRNERQFKGPDRFVEWDDAGRIIRVKGLETVVPRPVPTDYRRYDYRAAPSSGYKPWVWIIAVGVVAALVGRAARPGAPEEQERAIDSETPLPSQERQQEPKPVKRFPDDQLRDLSALSAMTGSEALVVALHKLGRELIALSRQAFDPDLADEINAIVEKHLAHAVDRYRHVRSSLGDVEAATADDSLRRALVRLTGRLRELWEEQQHRDVSGIDEAARFIDARHPQVKPEI